MPDRYPAIVRPISEKGLSDVIPDAMCSNSSSDGAQVIVIERANCPILTAKTFAASKSRSRLAAHARSYSPDIANLSASSREVGVFAFSAVQPGLRAFLERLINVNPDSKVLVFVRTKVRAERVTKAMARVNVKGDTIHSDKVQIERTEILTNFKNGTLKLLIATDVSARGIDIPNVDFVVNYDLPEVAENYVHRVGRTGRGTKKGRAVSFCSSDEKTILHEIENFLGKEITKLEIDKKVYKETLDFTEDTDYNWKKLIRDNEKELKNLKKKKK